MSADSRPPAPAPPSSASAEATRLRAALHLFSHRSAGYWLRFAFLLALGIWLGHYLSEAPRFEDLRNDIYQRQMRMQRHGLVYPQRTSLVLLDDDDYWGDAFAARTPLHRDRIAHLLDILNAAGVNIVALDIDLESPHGDDPNFDFEPYRTEDTALFDSIDRLCQANRRVVLSTSLADGIADYVEMPSLYDHHFAAILNKPDSCVVNGHIQLPSDMRHLPGVAKLDGGGQRDSLSLAITKIENQTAYQNATSNSDKGYRFSQYLNRADFSDRDGRRFVFSVHELESLDPATLRHALANRIVIIGGDWHIFARGDGDTVDLHSSPAGDLPGAMLHANYVEAMLDGAGTFTPISNLDAELLEISLALLIALVGALEVASHWKYTAFAASVILGLLLTYELMQNLGLFLDFLIPLAMLVLHTLVEELLDLRHHHAKPYKEPLR